VAASVSKQGEFIIFTLAISVLAASVLVSKHLKTAFDDLFSKFGTKYNVDSDLLRAIAQKESSMQADALAIEPSGHKSYGLMQILDTTAISLGIRDFDKLFDADTNIEAGSRLMSENRKTLGDKFSLDTWIASYRAGAPNVKKLGIVSPKTIDYVADVKQHYYLFKIGREVS